MFEANSTGGGLSVTGGGEFKFNWVSPGAGCWVLNINLVDGNTLKANFNLR